MVPLVLSTQRLQVIGDAGAVDISASDCELLLALTNSDKKRLNFSEMLATAGKPSDALGRRALDVQIVRLRKKLEQAGAARPTIKSIRGVGYQLCTSLTLGSPNPSFPWLSSHSIPHQRP